MTRGPICDGAALTPATDSYARASLVAVPAALVAGLGRLYREPSFTDALVPPLQPIPFSHQHPVGGLGIDCRSCHGAAEESPSAGLPATEACRHCRSQIGPGSVFSLRSAAPRP